MLSRRHFLMTGAAPLLAAKKKTVEGKRPNIVLVVADDLAAWMCGCYGQREIKTPNIDLLARMGIRFLNAFATTPADSVGRATLLSGRTPRQHGIQDFLTKTPIQDPPQGQAAPSPWFGDEVLLSDVLSAQGYNCGYVGKWDLGDAQRPGHGFSFTYTTAAEAERENPAVFRNGELELPRGNLTELQTAAASEFLDRQSADKPFFLTLGYQAAHAPYDGYPRKYYDMYADTRFESIGWLPKAKNALQGGEYMDDPVAAIRKYAAGVSALDAQIPVLLKKLRDRKFWSETLFIFTSENGHLLGRHGLWGAGMASNPPNMYDESIRVPLIASWPGEVPVEATTPDLVSAYDLLPTLCQAGRADLPAHQNLCGRSYYPQIVRQPRTEEDGPWPETVFGVYRDTLMARTNRFKVVIRDEGEGPNEFFRNRLDPREMRNEYDNPLVVTVRDRLRAEVDTWVRSYSK